MSTGRDWRTFNNAWRYGDPTRSFGRRLFRIRTTILWPLRHPHKTVKALEPWGILLAAIGLITAVASFWIDYHDRVQERTVRAWQLVTTPAPGNSGEPQLVVLREEVEEEGDDGFEVKPVIIYRELRLLDGLYAVRRWVQGEKGEMLLVVTQEHE